MFGYLNIKIREKGVTLIELLAAVTIFVIVIVAVSGILVSGIRSQRRVLATQELLDQASYVMEYMGRTLRMAKKELNCTNPGDPSTCAPTNSPFCLTTNGYGYNYELIPNGIRFIDYANNCTEFFLDVTTGQLKKSLIQVPLTMDLTSPKPKMEVTSFKINLSGEAQPPTDYLQPQITLFLEILGKESMGQPKIQIQTSISQRTLDVQY